jgi:hypothetical protein
MVLQPSNNVLPLGSNSLGSQSPSFSKNSNVSSNELAAVSLNPSVNVELSAEKVAVSAIPPIYSKPTVYSSNENQLSPSRLSSSSEALAENAILSKPSVASGSGEVDSKEEVEKKSGEAASTVFELSEDELKMIEELKARDLEVRTHEQAHKAVGGQYTGSISFSYQAGPDGKRYAVGGEVPIDVSPIPGDPQATIAKMTIVSAAATAPAQPSAQDQAVAAQAARTISEAQSEIAQQKYETINSNDEVENDKTDESASSDSSSSYTNNSLDTFKSVYQNDVNQSKFIDALV